MKAMIVLAMHGVPPRDFPRRELAEFMAAHTRLEHGGLSGEDTGAVARRCEELERRIRSWPRTPDNDPYHTAAHALAFHLRRLSSREVIVGFNEFCDPSVGAAIDEAVSSGAEKVVVVTPMMTAGGGHSEVDLPRAIGDARLRHPEVEIAYAWPFDPADVAGFLAAHVAPFVT